MSAIRLALAMLVLLALPVRAQGNTEEALERAIRQFEDFQVERALTLLRQIISTSSPFEVTQEQRVRAYKYLGASLAVVGQRDSSIVYFRAALERDPFTDLDPERFTDVERSAFTEARNQFLAVGVRPLVERRLNPATERLTLTFVSTHAAEMRVELREARTDARTVLFAGSSDGLREIAWDGLDASGRIAPEGRYEVVFAATSALTGRTDSRSLYFDLVHEREALEDTLPALRPEELLPERHPPSAAPLELARGLGLAASALLLPTVLGNSEFSDGDRRLVATVAGAAALTGVVASVVRHRQRDIHANIAANRQRTLERAAANRLIADRNSLRIAATKLHIVPAAGLTR